MNKTTIVYTVHNNYVIFRASIESLFAHIDSSTFHEIIIVDDCSSEQCMIDFLEYLNSLCNIRVIKAGKPADYSFHNNQQAYGRPSQARIGQASSVGHGVAQNIGIESTKTEFIMFVDSDILFMPKSKQLINSLENCMYLDEKIMSISQLVGEPRGIQIFEKPFKLHKQQGQLIEFRGGWPVHILAMSRVSGWTKEKLTIMCNGGWTNENHVPSLWKRGFKTCNFDIFVDGYAIHLGYATLRYTRSIVDKQKIVYCSDGGGYSKSRGSWYGHKFVPYTTDAFINLLNSKYNDMPFTARENIAIWE